MAYEWETEEARDALAGLTEQERYAGCGHTIRSPRTGVCVHCGDPPDP